MTTPMGGTNVSCPCGASLEIDPNETTQEIACPECGMTLEIAIAIDSRTKKVRLGILVKESSVAPRRTKGKGEEVHVAKCVCGAQITIEPGGVDAVYTCSACDADYTAVVKKTKAGGIGTLLLRPMIAAPAPKKPTTRSLPPPPKPKTVVLPPAPSKSTTKSAAKPAALPPTINAAGMVAKERLLQMSLRDVGAQEVADGRVQCFCGATIKLKADFHREIVKCAECTTGFRMFQATNPKNGDAMIVMIPRG